MVSSEMLSASARAACAETACRWMFPREDHGGEAPDLSGVYGLTDRHGGYWGASREKVEAVFATLPDSALTGFAEAVSADALPDEVLIHLTRLTRHWLTDALYAAGETRDSDVVLGNWVLFADVVAAVSRFSSVVTIGFAVDELVHTLHMYEDPAGELALQRVGYAAADEAEQATARAFVLARLLSISVAAPTFRPSAETVRLFERHHREPLRVAELVHERRALDPQVLSPILDSEVPAIAEGTL